MLVKVRKNVGTMSDDQFTKLFKYMERRFDEVGKRFEVVDQKFSQLQSTVDNLAGMVDGMLQEQMLANRQIAQHERWIQLAAPLIRLPYAHG